MANVAELMHKDIKKVPHTTTVKKAAMMMKTSKVGSLLVQKKRDLVGIVTETDIVRRAVAGGADLEKLTVEKIMTAPVVTIAAHQTAQDAHDRVVGPDVQRIGQGDGRLALVQEDRDRPLPLEELKGQPPHQLRAQLFRPDLMPWPVLCPLDQPLCHLSTSALAWRR